MKRTKGARARTTVLTAVAGLVLGTVAVVNAGTASADTPVSSPNLKYDCSFPLIGSQPIQFTASASLPTFSTGNSYALNITAVANLPLASADGLWAAKVADISGSATASATLYSPDYPNGTYVTTSVNIPKTQIGGDPLPAGTLQNVAMPGAEPTADVPINGISGTSPSVALKTGGWAQINVNNLDLKIDTADYQGNPTSLGTIDAHCWLLPGQTNVLGQTFITGGPAQTPAPTPFSTQPTQGPETVTGTSFPANPQSLTQDLTLTCPFPQIGTQSFTLSVKTDYPASVNTNTAMPPVKIDVVAHMTAAIESGLSDALGVAKMNVAAISNNVITTPDYPNGVRAQTTANLPTVEVPVDDTPDGSGVAFDVPGTAQAPSLAFQKPGTGSITIGDLPAENPVQPDMILKVNLLNEDGTPLKTGSNVSKYATFERNCTEQAGQANTLATWTIKQAGAAAPSVPTGLKATADAATGDTTFTWNASTNSSASGVSGYNVIVDGKTVGQTGGTSFTDFGVAGGSHTVAVSAADTSTPANTSAASANVAFTVGSVQNGPAKVTGLGSSEVTPTGFTLGWAAGTTDSGANITEYDVFQDGTQIGHTDGSTTSFAVTGLSADSTHSYTVSATDSNGKTGPVSDPLPVTTAPAPDHGPTPPTGLAATSQTSTGVTLGWDASTTDADAHITGYTVTETDGKVPPVQVTGTSATVSGLSAGTTYHFTVTATDSNGTTGAASSPVTVTVQAPASGPTTPANLAVVSQDSTSATIGWSPATTDQGSTVTGYTVTEADGKVPAQTVTGTQATFTGFKAGTTYHFTVTATDSAGLTSKAGGPLAVTIVGSGPSKVAGVTAGTVTATTAALSWQAATTDDGQSITGYTVLSDGTAVATTTGATSVTVKNLTPGTAYSFTVVATDSEGLTGPASDPAAVTTEQAATGPAQVTGLAATVSDSSVALSWDAATTDAGSTIAGYDVLQNGTQVDHVTGTSDTVTGLADGTYSFTVRATDSAGLTGPVSDPVSATVSTSGGGTHQVDYTLSGTSGIKAANGTVPLTGSINTDVAADGSYTGALTLAPAVGTFKLLGFVPATANIAFAPVGSVTGKLTGSSLTADTKVTVALPSVKVLGVSIGGGDGCQTASPAAIHLTSSAFTEASGGSLSGTYTLPSFQGCGSLTSLISALAAGPGNTLSVKLASHH